MNKLLGHSVVYTVQYVTTERKWQDLIWKYIDIFKAPPMLHWFILIYIPLTWTFWWMWWEICVIKRKLGSLPKITQATTCTHAFNSSKASHQIQCTVWVTWLIVIYVGRKTWITNIYDISYPLIQTCHCPSNVISFLFGWPMPQP
jgi:hypothetical protein